VQNLEKKVFAQGERRESLKNLHGCGQGGGRCGQHEEKAGEGSNRHRGIKRESIQTLGNSEVLASGKKRPVAERQSGGRGKVFLPGLHVRGKKRAFSPEM